MSDVLPFVLSNKCLAQKRFRGWKIPRLIWWISTSLQPFLIIRKSEINHICPLNVAPKSRLCPCWETRGAVSSCDSLLPQPRWSTAFIPGRRRCRGNVGLRRASLSVFGKQDVVSASGMFLCCLHRGQADFLLTSDVYSTNCTSDQILFCHPEECCSEITSGGVEGWGAGGGREGDLFIHLHLTDE